MYRSQREEKAKTCLLRRQKKPEINDAEITNKEPVGSNPCFDEQKPEDSSFVDDLGDSIMQKGAMFNVMNVAPNEDPHLDVGMDEDSVEDDFINGEHFSIDETESIGRKTYDSIFSSASSAQRKFRITASTKLA